MKFLIIQSDGMHKGLDSWAPNWFLRECYGLQDAILRNGHLADVWGLRHDNYAQTPDFESYDFIIIAENYEFDWIPTLAYVRKPIKIQWIIDLHYQGCAPYLDVCRKHKPQIVLHATQHLIASFSIQYEARHIWFPNAVDDRYFNASRYNHTPKSSELVFVGGVGGTRASAVVTMQKEAGLVSHYGVTGYAYLDLLAGSKIQFNKAIDGDINYRNFETISMGTCLLTNYDPCLAELGFVSERNCLIYRTIEEAVEMARATLKHSTWRLYIDAGLTLARDHSYFTRIKDLINKL